MVSGNNPVYRFYHYYDTEKGFDGGILEISTLADPEWKLIDNEIFRNSYPTLFNISAFGLPFPLGYTGLSSQEKKMDPTYVDLREYIGELVKNSLPILYRPRNLRRWMVRG
ncbi:MAG: hypothetical protein IPN60_15905 [Saprospiraceae bacterium]|nr:hypothetical protein [Candidatus Opimibacter skivensis]